VVKLDMSLVRDIDKEPRKAQIVGGMVELCVELGAQVVVEGVETAAERDTLHACGCDWMQGYLFAKPAAELVVPDFSI
jgi:EAL domain-containing protein (putative c-di-GMP-specific phosphodiesterase class I)